MSALCLQGLGVEGDLCICGATAHDDNDVATPETLLFSALLFFPSEVKIKEYLRHTEISTKHMDGKNMNAFSVQV